MKYVKYFWQYIADDTPVLIYAELDKERYSTRCVNIFSDRHMEREGEFEAYVSEAPYPSNDEINEMGEFKIFDISKAEFEEVWNRFSETFIGDLDFIE